MKRFFKKPFVSENELEFEQLRIEDELLHPRRPQKLSAERTVSELMRSEYASTNAVSELVATEKADGTSATEATKKHQNVENNILNITECDDAFTLDDLQTILLPDIQVCEDCTNCDNYEECFAKKGD